MIVSYAAIPKAAVAMLLFSLLAPIHAHAGQIGTTAPGLALPDLNGNTITLETYKGKVIFLDFWAPWCKPCQEEMPALDTLYKTYGKDGFVVIGVCMDTPEAGVEKFLRSSPVSFPVLVDKKGTSARTYLFSNLPIGYLIDRTGVIRYQHAGYGIDSLHTYEKEIELLLKQQ